MKKVGFSIGGKILGGFLTLIVLFALSAAISIMTLNSGISLTERTTEVTNPSAVAIVNFLSMVNESEKLITSWVYLQNNDDNKQALKDLQAAYPQQKEVLIQLGKAWSDSTQSKQLDTIFSQFESLTQAEQDIMTSLVSFEDYEDPMAKLMAENVIEDEIIPRTREIRRRLEEISNVKQLEAEQAQIDNIASYLQLRQVILVLGVVTILLGLIAAFMLSRTIVRPISHLQKIILELGKGRLPEESTPKSYKFSQDEVGQMADAVDGLVQGLRDISEFAESIGKGEYEEQFTPLSDEDILGNSLINMRDNLRQVAEEDKVRNWATEGSAKFGELLRQNNEDVQQLTQTILSHLISYLHANQGGLYLVQSDEEEEQFMTLDACYAWDREKYLEQKIYKGEGLAGQAWQEKDTIYLTDVPDEYVTIASGLGDANPTSILIVPLLVNEEVHGVIELASFEEFAPHEIEFLQKIAESIASTVSSVKINARTQQLLAESQQMTEEMQSQEEEMRQNMEELQATQEEMERNTSKFKNQVDAIDQSGIAFVEFNMDGTVASANESFLSLMQYRIEEIQGKHHKMFVSSEYAQSDEYQQFWEELRAGSAKPGDYRRRTKHGNDIYIRGCYSTVKDKEGIPTKVIKFAIDITNLEQTNQRIIAQEEEMRQNVEELLATQEEMAQKQKALEAALSANKQ